jgi:glycosyltransferase involved in cell wall biosynthesis
MRRNTFRVLFLIENVPYSLDGRVRREAHTLKSVGGDITVICPSDGGSWVRTVDGVRVYHYPKPSFTGGFLAHVTEYVASLFFHFILTLWVALRHGFDVVHVANPPDLLWLVAAPYRLFGKRFIFDHHDLVPELFEVRFRDRMPWLHSLMLWLERQSIQLANHVICTNNTFRHVAITRGGKKPDDVTVVRNGPWLSRDFPVVPRDEKVRELGDVIVGYVGIINAQDHVDNLLDAARIIRYEMGRKDIGFILVGSGDAYPALLAQRDAMGLSTCVSMPGSLPWKEVVPKLSAADICVQPDLPTIFNRHLTMNKLMEYMAFGKATAAYDMTETRFSGADTVHYIPGTSAHELATAIVELADDPERRADLGRRARQRIEDTLAWEHQAQSLLRVYARLLPDRLSESAAPERT